MATSGSLASFCATSSISSVGSTCTATRVPWAASASASLRKRASETTTSRPWGSASSSFTNTHGSSVTTARFLSSGICGLLEGLHAHTAIAIEEALVFRTADGQVLLHHALDGAGHLLGGNGGPDDLAERGVVAG